MSPGNQDPARASARANVVVAGGGTAGHVYPGIALAHALRARVPDARIAFVGTARGIETQAVPDAGFPLHLIDVVPWSKTLGAKRYLAPIALVRAVAQARRVLAGERASVVVGMGGYASIPVVLAARSRRIPALLHEQNAVPGLANLGGARVVRDVALAFEEARRYFPRGARVRVVGNPIRATIADLDRIALRAEARAALGLEPDAPTLVVFGGSLGAARLNVAAASIAAMWKDRADRQILVIGGRARAGLDEAHASERMIVVEYVDRMDLVYAAADVVVSRAGATTVAELGAAAMPAVLVPYPYARRDHQTANARAYAAHGAAIVVADADATGARLARLVDALLDDPARASAMADAARAAAKPDASGRLAAWVLELAGEGA